MEYKGLRIEVAIYYSVSELPGVLVNNVDSGSQTQI